MKLTENKAEILYVERRHTLRLSTSILIFTPEENMVAMVTEKVKLILFFNVFTLLNYVSFITIVQ